jgi:uncharacterized protein
MTKEYLPLKVDPFRFADNESRLHGGLPVKNMQRLSPSLASVDGMANVDIHFGVDEQGIRFVRGHVIASVGLVCQRCMEPFNYEIIDDFLLGIVQTDEQADELPERYDPLVIKGMELLIQDVVEDELIVSLPIVSLHSKEECTIKLPLITASEMASEKENPFKVIELLREKRNKD